MFFTWKKREDSVISMEMGWKKENEFQIECCSPRFSPLSSFFFNSSILNPKNSFELLISLSSTIEDGLPTSTSRAFSLPTCANRFPFHPSRRFSFPSTQPFLDKITSDFFDKMSHSTSNHVKAFVNCLQS